MKKSRLLRILLKHVFPLFIGIILLVISEFNHMALASKNLLFTIGILFICYDIIYSALKDMLTGNALNENIFMLICIIGTYLFREYSICIIMCALFKIHYITQDVYSKAYSKNLISILNFIPKNANIKINGELVKQSPQDIAIGDTIIVAPGEIIPLDGIVISGTSSVNEYKLTGDAKPRNIKLHDEVLNGSINIQNTITVKVTREFANSTVMKIKTTIINSLSSKSRKVNVTNRILNTYITIIIFLALTYIFIPPFFSKDAVLMTYVHNALKFMVLFSPLAIITNVYISYLFIIKSLRKEGISLRNHVVLESLNKIHTLVIDDSFINLANPIDTIDDFKNQILSGKLQLIEELKGKNISHIVILKYFPMESDCYDDDNYTTANITTDKLNIDIISCAPMPFIRSKILRNIMGTKSKHSNVVFFGNGINNVHLLCKGDIGVTAYNHNDDSALKAADIVITNSDMSTMNKLITFSKKTKEIILQNFIFCFAIKLLILFMYHMMDISIFSAILIESLCCLPIVLNCLRLVKNR